MVMARRLSLLKQGIDIKSPRNLKVTKGVIKFFEVKYAPKLVPYLFSEVAREEEVINILNYRVA